METDSYDFEMQPQKRPTFLTVLCILTFIGSGWAIISAYISYRAADEASQFLQKPIQENVDSSVAKDSVLLNDTVASHKNQKEVSPFEKKMKASFTKMLTKENIENSSMGSMLAAFFTLAGAILMWKLKKLGFYLYIVGVLIGIIIPFYLYGNNFLAIGIASFSSFFGLIFIALYALNFKSFTK